MSINNNKKTVEAMDIILEKEFSVLNSGFIRVIDYMGNDSSIVQAARVSYGQGTKTINQDEGLIRYLMRHSHTTPFEMCEIKLHIKAPIFVARQWLRHRTASVNEISARYSILSDEFFIPELHNIAKQSINNKQGRSEEFEKNIAEDIQDKINKNCNNTFELYNEFINKENLAREISRTILPVGTYTEFYWKIDLHNLMHFLKLRVDPHAQKEIRIYAEIILEILQKWVPITYQAFMDYKVNSISLSAKDILHLSKCLDIEKINQKIEELSKSKGENLEFISKIQQILSINKDE